MSLPQNLEQYELPDSLDGISRVSALGLDVEDALKKDPICLDSAECTAPYISYRRLGLGSANQDCRRCSCKYIVAATNEKLYFRFYRVKDRMGIAIAQCNAYPEGKIIYRPISGDSTRFKFWHGEEQQLSLTIEPEDLILRSSSGRAAISKNSGHEVGKEQHWGSSPEYSDTPLICHTRKQQTVPAEKSSQSSSQDSSTKRKSDEAGLLFEDGKVKRQSLPPPQRPSPPTAEKSTPSSQLSWSMVSGVGSQEQPFAIPSASGSQAESPAARNYAHPCSQQRVHASSTNLDVNSQAAAAKSLEVVVHFKLERGTDPAARVRDWSLCTTVEKFFSHALAFPDCRGRILTHVSVLTST